MRTYLYIGSGVAALALAGWLYYIHSAHVPPAPKDMTAHLPRQILEKATKAQLAVFRGEATVALKADDAAEAAAAVAAPAAVAGQPAPLADPAGLQVTLAMDQLYSLKGQAGNASAQPIVYARPAGTLFSNGEGTVVLLKNVSVEVPAKGKASLSLPVAQTTVGERPLTGPFTPRAGAVSDTLQPLVELLAHKQNVAPAVAQAAVLIVNDDAPLDRIAGFPRLEPPAFGDADRPLSVSPADLIAALQLIQEAGLDPAKSALMSEPQLKVMTLLDAESHPAAMEFYGLSEQTEWSYWKKQLLDGDPALRHYAFYGIARYYPEVALQMLPRWVRDPGVYRSYRLSAAWALALVGDARASQELAGLRDELQGDAGLRQTLDRALQHWNADNGQSGGARAGKTAGSPTPTDTGHAG